MKPIRSVRWIPAALVLLFPPAHAQDSSPPQTKEIKVLVTDAATQEPVADAEVSAYFREPVKVRTNASGIAIVPVRPVQFAEKDARFSFRVESPRHESREVEWFSDHGNVRETLPAEYKVQLRAGSVAGGIVQDERGAPISGARVVLFASGLRGRSLGRGDQLQQEYGVFSISEENALVTDAEGRWRQDHFPTDITQISVEVIRPEGARTRFLSGSMYRAPTERGGIVELPALLKQSAVFTLKDGVTLRGQVVDSTGRPVGGVQLRVRDAVGRHTPYTFVNQTDGTFVLPHWDVNSVLVTAEKEGFQATSATIDAGGDTGGGRIVLTPAKPLRIRIVGENDAPIAGAELQTDSNPRPDYIVNWKARSDADGRAEWPTAPDKPVTLWITPPPGSHYPFRSARLVADGTEQVIRVRPGADRTIRLNFRVVDADTGAPVPTFEVWRRLANQPFQPWGEPAAQGTLARELNVAELPNGWVPAYRLQIRAAGYSGWASEPLEFSFGDQELTIKLTKGESKLADDLPTPRPGTGINHQQDPQLLALGAAVAALLETGDVKAFVRSANATLDDWKRLLPPGVDASALPLGPDPMRIITHREKALAASATHVLEIARRAGLEPGVLRFTVKLVGAPAVSSTGYKIGSSPLMMPAVGSLRVTLTGEPRDPAARPALRGDYELNLGTTRKFPHGWRTDDGVRWAAMPDGVGDAALRRSLGLVNRIAPTSVSDRRMLSAMDDPALARFAAIVGDLLQQRNPSAFVTAARLTREETVDFYRRTDRTVNEEVLQTYARNSTNLGAAAAAMCAQLERLGVELGGARLTVKQVLAESPRFMQFGNLDGVSSFGVRLTLTAETDRKSRSGQPLAGDYMIAVGNVLRLGDRWVMVDDKLRVQEFPSGIVSDQDLKQLEFDNYVAEHHTLPPGHQPADVPFFKLSDHTPTRLSAYRGKVVILEFWAVWCGPCQEPMEKLQALSTAYPEWKDNVEVIALSLDDKADTAREHLEKNAWTKTFNVWAGEGGWRSPAPAAFKVGGIPTIYVLDRNGRVIKAGHPVELDLAAIVNAELRKPSL